ncbi:hypothetical protein O9929_23355 [Vibrio lentus]|nr:hypothetical protein [Vibrio lentus]
MVDKCSDCCGYGDGQVRAKFTSVAFKRLGRWLAVQDLILSWYDCWSVSFCCRSKRQLFSVLVSICFAGPTETFVIADERL